MTSADGLMQAFAKNPEFDWANNDSMMVPLLTARGNAQTSLSSCGRTFLALDMAQIKKMYKDADSHLSKFSLDMDPPITELQLQVAYLLSTHTARQAVAQAARKKSDADME